MIVGLLALAALASATPVTRVAVIAGRNDGGPERTTLRWAHKDARAVDEVLGALGGVAPGDRFLLIEPDRPALAATLALAQARLALAPPGARTELVFYYSGHADEVGLLLGTARYPFRELRAHLDAVRADLRLVIVDACASGALIGMRAKGGVPAAPFLADGDLAGHAYLTSAAADEVAQESDHLEASFFTHDLLTALRGAADGDHDRTVTLTEAYRFAFAATLARTQATRAPQHPAWDIALRGAGDVVMTRLERAGARLVLGADLGGRFFVRGERDVLVAELDKDRGAPLELALPEAALRVATVADGRRLEASVTLVAGRAITLSSKEFTDRGPALEGRPRGPPPRHVRLSFIPLLGLEGLGDDLTVHGAALAFIGDRVLAIRGAQLATVFNVAEEVTGAQIGLVNVGGRVRGAQIGLVNVADSLEGASLALFPWVGGDDGLRHLELYADSARPLNLGWRVGARWLHTAVALGTDGTDCDLRIAVGTEIDLSPVSLDFDLGTILGARRCDPATLGEHTAAALRAIVGVRVAPWLMLIAGGQAVIETGREHITPGVTAGLRLFR